MTNLVGAVNAFPAPTPDCPVEAPGFGLLPAGCGALGTAARAGIPRHRLSGVRWNHSQSGRVSRAMISSTEGRARITAKLSPFTSTSGASGRVLYSLAITAP